MRGAVEKGTQRVSKTNRYARRVRPYSGGETVRVCKPERVPKLVERVTIAGVRGAGAERQV